MEADRNGYVLIKAVHLILTLGLLLFAIGGNWYIAKYRLDKVELKAGNSEQRINALRERIILMDLKLDLLLQKNGIDLPEHRLRGN